MANTESFDEFYDGTRGHLLRQLTAMTADPELAADCLQDAYERAWQRWSRVGRFDDPQSWVRTVAWRAAVSQFRRRTVARRFTPALRHQLDEGPPQLEEAWDVRAALRAMDPERRRALVLYEMCGLSVEQVAAETNAPIGTVKSRLARGRAELAEGLGAGYRTDRTDPAHPTVPTSPPGSETLAKEGPR